MKPWPSRSNFQSRFLRRLEAEAARRGVSPDTLAIELVEQSVVALPAADDETTEALTSSEEFFGFRPFGKRGSRVTSETVDQLRDEFAV